MKRVVAIPLVVLLVAAHSVSATRAAESLDLRRGVPEDVFLVVQAMHNPERDYQEQYYEEVWKTVQETRILERALEIATSRMGEEDLAQAQSVVEDLEAAVEPIDLKALADCQEMIYAQEMVMWQAAPQAPAMPTSQHLLLLRLTPEQAAATAKGVRNLFELVEKYSDGQLAVVESQVGEATLATLQLPPQSPMQPTVTQLGEVLALCSSKELLNKSLNMMTGSQGTSKFDDPRLATALDKLPQAEDQLVFYDGRAQFDTLKKIGPSLAQVGGGDPNIERVVKFINMAMEELSVFDYEVTVGYTEGNLNRTATYGKLIPGTQDATLRKMVSTGESFEDWASWVPAGAVSYSLGTGVNLHVLYERIMKVLKEDVPEAENVLKQFQTIQEQYNVFLDRDILQAFSGEYVSVAVLMDNNARHSVFAMRCHKPEQTEKLIHRGMEALQQIEAVQAQQLKLVESEQLEGFEKVSAGLLMMTGMNPVIGFRNGWMYIGQSADAVSKVLDTLAGESETVKTTDAYKRLDIEIDQPVRSVRYVNTAENLRAMADGLRKAGGFVQMAMSMAGAQAEDESVEVIKEIVALLPDVAKILEEFDFLQARINVVQQGESPDSYTKRSVVVVEPAEQQDAEG
jgi:hypothetical protein